MSNLATVTERDWTRPAWQEEVLASNHRWKLVPQFNEERDMERAERAYEEFSRVIRFAKSSATELNRLKCEPDRREEELRVLQNGQDPYTDPEKTRIEVKEYSNFDDSEDYDEEGHWGGCFEEQPGFRALESAIAQIRADAQDIRETKAKILVVEAQIRRLRP